MELTDRVHDIAACEKKNLDDRESLIENALVRDTRSIPESRRDRSLSVRRESSVTPRLVPWHHLDKGIWAIEFDPVS